MARRAVLSYPYGTAHANKEALSVRQLSQQRGGFLRYAVIYRRAHLYAVTALYRRCFTKKAGSSPAGELHVSRHHLAFDRHRHHRICVLSAISKQAAQTSHEAGQLLSAAQRAHRALGHHQRNQLSRRDDPVLRVCIPARFPDADRRACGAECSLPALRPKTRYPAGQHPVLHGDWSHCALLARRADRGARTAKELYAVSARA